MINMRVLNVLFVVASLAWGWSATHHLMNSGPQSPVSESQAASKTTDIAPPRKTLRGPGACTGAGCHGAALSRDGSPPIAISRTSYTLWLQRDPHVRATLTLYSERSQRILKSLLGTEVSSTSPEYAAELQQRCVECHATHPHEAQGEDDLVSMGVSCEACHGPAGAWLETHTDTKHRREGMVDTSNLRVRAEVCVHCHIGPGKESLGQQTVDHQLIAAGHPRLNFEFSAYLEALPAHWQTGEDQSIERKSGQRRVNFHAEAWWAGQQASQQQALGQLHRRLEGTLASNRQQDWPELSEYDCFACHHGIKSQPQAFHTKGHPRWGSWYFPDQQQAPLLVTSLRADMETWAPDLEKVRERLKGHDWSHSSPEKDPLKKLEEFVLAPVRYHGWDEATQWYLAVRAYQRGLVPDAKSAKPDPVVLTELAGNLNDLHDLLDYGQESSPTPQSATFHWESPKNFDPQSPRLLVLQIRIRKLIEQLSRTR